MDPFETYSQYDRIEDIGSSSLKARMKLEAADNDFLFGRQDSLVICEQLQEKDGYNFMDEKIDLTPYLTSLQGNGGSPNYGLDSSVDKQKLIQSDIISQLDVEDCHYSNIFTDETNLQNCSDDTFVPPLQCPVSVKPEASWDDESVDGTEDSMPSTSTAKETTKKVCFTPTIIPRRYSLKPEAEKKNPLYRLKREKNNDAVRKSRSKAKEQQKLKDHMIENLFSNVTELQKMVEKKDEIIAKKDAEIMELREIVAEMRDKITADFDRHTGFKTRSIKRSKR